MSHSGPDRIPKTFFARDPERVARELLGCQLASEWNGMMVMSRIVETEAYRGQEDPASHAYRGPTKRTAVMFAAPGHAYVYRSYGVHWCCNVVAHTEGVAGAVLIRSGELLSGEEYVRMRLDRNADRPRSRLLSGPGLFARGHGITQDANGLPFFQGDSPLRLYQGCLSSEEHIISTPRIGISAAQELKLRFCIAGHPSVSGLSRLRR